MSDRALLERLDAEARERALDPRASILLQAPAGSGKTTVLTQRILRLLAEVDEPEEIIAITFTRKAAGEMRERVFRALRGEIDDSTPQGRRVLELARAVQERSRERGWSLEASPGRLRIQTIDALNRFLARHLPIAARAIGDLDVAERPEALYRLAARRTLLDAESDERLEADAELLFERLDNDFGRFERLLTAMLAARAHWLPRLLEADEPALCARVEASLESIVGERLSLAQRVFPHALLAEGADLAAQAAARRIADGDTSEGAWRVWLESPRPPQAFSLRHWQALAALALTQDGNWRSTLTKREGFAASDKALKSRAQRWLADLALVPGARELLVELGSLPEPRLSPQDAAALEALARLLKLAAGELELVFQETRRVDYTYIAAAARRALTEEGAPTDLGLRLGARIRHILVDEFQDTSIEQCALLQALTAGWEEGDGRTLFLVGDPMQSIYQFREAEVGLFLRTRESGLGNVRLQPLTLTRNFRSLPELVEWTNRAFPRVFPALDDPRASAVRFLPSVASRTGPAPGQVRLHRTPPGDAAAEARHIVELIRDMRSREPSASIAVLVTARAHAAPIAAALQDAGVPVAGVDLVPLAEVPVVRDLTALARALDHLGDRTAWLAVLRAPWCGLTLRELTRLLESAPHATVWEVMNDPAAVERLAEDARKRLLTARDVLARALAARDRQDFASWVETTWLRLGGPSACDGADDLEHAQAFFTALMQWTAGPDWDGPLGLTERLSELFANQTEVPADAVQIMTIHRAKGLEFDKVIVPGLGRRTRSDPEPLLRWLELPRDPDGSDLLMAPLPGSTRRGREPLNEYLKSLQARRSAHERARLLYVAATRARSELHLIGELPEASDPDRPVAPASGTLLATLWPAIAAEFPPEPIAASTAAMREGTQPALIRRLPSDWVPPEVPAGPTPQNVAIASYEPRHVRDFPWASEVARCVGTVVHEQLRRWSRQGTLPSHQQIAATRRALEERLGRLGLTGAEWHEALEKALAALSACAADARSRWIFSNAHAEIACPLELTGVYEGRLVSVLADRSFVDEQGTRWVIDFKVVAPEGGDIQTFVASELERYRAELERCVTLARRLGPQPVRGALYFPLLCVFREL